MTKEEIKRRIEIEQAWVEGKKIQFIPTTGQNYTWETMDENDAKFDWMLYDYRIMPDDWNEKKEKEDIKLDILRLNNRIYSLECRIKALEENSLSLTNPFPLQDQDTIVAYGCPTAPYKPLIFTSQDNTENNNL